jgi:hypothetical protein
VDTTWEPLLLWGLRNQLIKAGGTQMVESKKSNFRKNRNPKGFSPNGARAKKINASTAFDTCSEQLSPFGGLLPLIKFMDLVEFQKIFDFTYKPPTRKPKLGHYSMVVGLLMLLFISNFRLSFCTNIS